MQRLAVAATFPPQISLPLPVGPEIAREGVAAIQSVFEELLPARPSLRFSYAAARSEAAVALSIAPAYTDHVDTLRPGPEIQQNLLPPRIARVGGATIAGKSCPDVRSAETGLTMPRTLGAAGSGLRTPPAPGRRPPASAPSPSEHFAASAENQPIPPKACSPCMRSCCNSVRATPPPAPRSDSETRPPRPLRWVAAGDEHPVRNTSDGELTPSTAS
jgi:hypothetical protein